MCEGVAAFWCVCSCTCSVVVFPGADSFAAVCLRASVCKCVRVIYTFSHERHKNGYRCCNLLLIGVLFVAFFSLVTGSVLLTSGLNGECASTLYGYAVADNIDSPKSLSIFLVNWNVSIFFCFFFLLVWVLCVCVCVRACVRSL